MCRFSCKEWQVLLSSTDVIKALISAVINTVHVSDLLKITNMNHQLKNYRRSKIFYTSHFTF